MRSKQMAEFDSIEALAKKIKENLDSNKNKKKISILYAFNSIGKTRLSTAFSELTENKVLCYNAFVEDFFKWDNENYVLTIDPKSWIVKLINEQGIELNISDNFIKIINSKIEPYFNLSKGEITFNIPSGDDKSNIKISKGEESMFIWSIFYTILETAIDAINTDEDKRTTPVFNDLEYVIVDDPVSSIDDTKIITMAIKLIETIHSSKNNMLKFFITTHHALFYNVFFNSFKKNNDYKFHAQILSRNGTKIKLENQSDSPFGYHLVVKDEIQKAIDTNTIKKYHFNLFRNILEKTANFLGYNNWADCIYGDNKQECIKLLNLNSHSRLSDLEYRELSDEDKILFQKTFNEFVKEFKWKVEE